MPAADPDSAARPRSPRSRTPWWARVAAVGAWVALVAVLNQFDDCAGHGGMVESAGWPLTFLVHDGNVGTTRIVAHSLLLNLFVWTLIALGAWYATGGFTGRRDPREKAGRAAGAAPDTGAGADREA